MKKDDLIALDKRDPLAQKRDAFDIPEGMIYLDGNSLGVLPKSVKTRVSEVVETQWGQDLISSWNAHDWIDLPQKVGEKIARLIGAAPGQTVCCDSISVNLFKLLSAAISIQKRRGEVSRKTILSVSDNFPTDLYIAQGLESLLGDDRCQLKTVTDDTLADNIDETVAVLMLTHVNFRSGEISDMRAITELAHEKGVVVIWDLAHSAGALPLALDECNVDFAVGCGYKYLNGGPGAPAFVYVAKHHHGNLDQPLSGWMGHASPFAFDNNYQPAHGITQFLSGTPSIIAMSALDAALDVFDDVDMNEIRHKSLGLTNALRELIETADELNDLVAAFPHDECKRGSQVAYRHPHAYAICQALIKEGVVADFRAPDILRLGVTPLYTRYEDVWICVEKLRQIIGNKRFLQPEFAMRNKVT